MNLAIEQKALAACRESAAAAKEIARLKQVIGDSLSACHAEYTKQNPDGHPLAWKSHLEAAYSFETIKPGDYDDDYEGTGRVYLDADEQQAVLSACPHCLAAHNAIQDRKQARKRLGNARRAITRIGRGHA